MIHFLPDSIRTFSGKLVRPLALAPDDVLLVDIAHALSNQCRYSGHCPRFYSVAEHSVYVADHVPPEHRRWGLLHDAAEAYLVDLPSPLKRAVGFGLYREAEQRAMLVIAEKFRLDWPEPQSIRDADQRMLVTEQVAFWRNDVVLDPDAPAPYDDVVFRIAQPDKIAPYFLGVLIDAVYPIQPR